MVSHSGVGGGFAAPPSSGEHCRLKTEVCWLSSDAGSLSFMV